MNWISVNDRLPEDGQTILSVNMDSEHKDIYFGNYLSPKKDIMCLMGCCNKLDGATHWLPVSEIPLPKD